MTPSGAAQWGQGAPVWLWCWSGCSGSLSPASAVVLMAPTAWSPSLPPQSGLAGRMRPWSASAAPSHRIHCQISICREWRHSQGRLCPLLVSDTVEGAGGF